MVALRAGERMVVKVQVGERSAPVTPMALPGWDKRLEAIEKRLEALEQRP